MKKISTLYKKDPNNLGRIIDEINPENAWALQAIATRKFDGTSSAIINGELYKRYDAKIKPDGTYKRPIPNKAIPCQDADLKSGHHPHWVQCERTNKADKYHFEGFDALDIKTDGTYELCGPKVQGNPENINEHQLVPHGKEVLLLEDRSFEGLKQYLIEHDIEGIVFHHENKMCKIRKTDFGIRR
ncbi:MAG: hypothetical protein ACI8ZM_002305 [Crocinitomix sp.]|jgi:hypothetical protein